MNGGGKPVHMSANTTYTNKQQTQAAAEHSIGFLAELLKTADTHAWFA
jgi:hypothetical protein